MSVYVKKDNKGKKRTDTPTDLRVCDFIYKIVSDKYTPKKILDPCAGDRRLTDLFKCGDTETINYEIKDGTDFLKETNKIDCDFVICNPPFNLGGTMNRLLAIRNRYQKQDLPQ
jgi:type I restriction-modification system DNA methylase subunit